MVLLQFLCSFFQVAGIRAVTYFQKVNRGSFFERVWHRVCVPFVMVPVGDV